jgi:competence protein ComEC
VRLGISRVDLLVLTHFDLDHVGGVRAVQGMVDAALHGPPADAGQQRLLDDLAGGGADMLLAHSGMTGSLGDAAWTVLWPPQGSRAFPTGNQASVVLDVRGHTIPPSIFLGDLDAIAQRALLRSGTLRPPYPIVKVAHHGSADQAPELYTALRPVVAIISVGVDNDYGHPRSETLEFLTRDGASIARTDREGLVVITGSRTGVSVWRERAPPSRTEAQ